MYSKEISDNFYAIYAVLPIGTLFAFLIYFGTHKAHPPKAIGLMAFISFLTAILWIYVFSGMMIGILRIAGYIADVPPPFLGATILAIGNSVPGKEENS